MNKLRMIEEIRSHNRSARTDFLVHFNEEALSEYLSRLNRCQNHRGRDSVWVRQTPEPAMVTRACA